MTFTSEEQRLQEAERLLGQYRLISWDLENNCEPTEPCLDEVVEYVGTTETLAYAQAVGSVHQAIELYNIRHVLARLTEAVEALGE